MTTKGTKGSDPFSRRRFLKGTASTAALFSSVQMQFPGGAFAQGAGPEVKKSVLGYIALIDASPLVIAKEKGLFAKHGMPDVEVSKQASWGGNARQHRARRRRQRHRRRAHPDADALPHLDRQGHAEQCADADVHPGAP